MLGGVWCVVCGVWCVVCGVCGVWCVVCGVAWRGLCVACGVCGVWCVGGMLDFRANRGMLDFFFEQTGAC